ncbi:MAG: DMT family transporter [Alphaproteobacteria bacterium]|nr:DMT family transporter [Alphaproteobacteria bacterium]
MERRTRIDAIGASCLVAAALLLGLNQVLIKLVNAGLQPVFQVGLRSACAIVPVVCFALLARRKLSVTDGSFWPGVACGLLFATEFVLLFLALEFTTVARASIMFYTMPFWLAVAAHYLIPGERLNRFKVFGLVLAIVGIVLAFYDPNETAGDKALLGDLMCLAGAFLWGGIPLMVRTTQLSKSTPEMHLVYMVAVSAVVVLPISPLFGDLVRDITPGLIAIFAVQVLFVVSTAFLTWFWLLKIYPAAKVASYSFLSPLFGVFFGWLILGEHITIWILLALALVSVGIVFVNKETD